MACSYEPPALLAVVIPMTATYSTRSVSLPLDSRCPRGGRTSQTLPSRACNRDGVVLAYVGPIPDTECDTSTDSSENRTTSAAFAVKWKYPSSSMLPSGAASRNRYRISNGSVSSSCETSLFVLRNRGGRATLVSGSSGKEEKEGTDMPAHTCLPVVLRRCIGGMSRLKTAFLISSPLKRESRECEGLERFYEK